MSHTGWTAWDVISLVGAITALVVALGNLLGKASKGESKQAASQVNDNSIKRYSAVSERLATLEGKIGVPNPTTEDPAADIGTDNRPPPAN